MDILVSGSMAYDRIMKFGGRFRDHILADQLDNINISFGVDSLTEHIGGTAGNIAYSLSLLGEKPRILASIGRDYHRYFAWLMTCGIGTADIRVVEEELTAGAYITTDANSNQFTGFNPGAMKHQAEFDYEGVDPSNTIAIVGPGNLADMMQFTSTNSELGIFSIFDPGQSLPIWEPGALARCIQQSNVLICNEYELGMISNNTGLSQQQHGGHGGAPRGYAGRGGRGGCIQRHYRTSAGDSHKRHRPHGGGRRLSRRPDQGANGGRDH